MSPRVTGYGPLEVIIAWVVGVCGALEGHGGQLVSKPVMSHATPCCLFAPRFSPWFSQLLLYFFPLVFAFAYEVFSVMISDNST